MVSQLPALYKSRTKIVTSFYVKNVIYVALVKTIHRLSVGLELINIILQSLSNFCLELQDEVR